MTRARAVPAGMACALLAGLAAGCVSVPTSGPVRAVEQAPIDESEGVNSPAGPDRGASPTDIVTGFLDAMEAYPVSTSVAADFLTEDAAERWRPGRGTVVYGERSTTGAGRGAVTLEVDEAVRLTRRGTYRPAPSPGTVRRDRFTLHKVGGEWRITDPPNALYISSYFFDNYYAPFDLYFLDPTREILVPDPVYLPTGNQLATQLVRGLLAGPTPWLGSQATTSPPRSAQIEVSVPLRDGVAEVQLSEPVADLSEEQQQLLSAQLVWTLRQIPGVDAVRITVDGAPLGGSGVDEVQAVDEWPQYDPMGRLYRNRLYALDRDGALTVVGEDAPVEGRWARRDLTDFSIDRFEELVAGIQGGDRLVSGPLLADERGAISRAYAGDGRLSDPQWDRTGLLWVLEHGGAGQRGRTAWVVLGDGNRTVVPAGRLGGARVSHMAVSSDGARVAALVPQWDGPVWGGGSVEGPCVVVARVLRRADGKAVRRLDKPYAIPVPDLDIAALRDVEWSSPSDVMVLADVAPLPPQPVELAIDGSVVEAGPDSSEDLLRALRGVTLASAGAPTVVGDRSGDLSIAGSEGQWLVLDVNLMHPHYPS